MYEDYDGVLLIHPDWCMRNNLRPPKGITEVYQEMVKAQDECYDQSIPFIIEPSSPTSRNSLIEIGFDMKKIKLLHWDNPVRKLEKLIGKTKEQISLLIGGIHFDACVTHWMQLNCQQKYGLDELTLNNYKKTTRIPPNPNPDLIKSGTIHYPLTNRWLENNQ